MSNRCKGNNYLSPCKYIFRSWNDEFLHDGFFVNNDVNVNFVDCNRYESHYVMKNRQLRILMVGDASNYHRALAGGLREMGHDVVLASNGSGWMDTERDIDLSRKDGKLSGARLWFKLCRLMKSRLRGFDVVQLNNPVFVNLRPERNIMLFRELKRHNRSIFLTALGTDTAYADLCLSPSSPLAYNEWMVYGKPSPYHIQSPEVIKAWLEDPLKSHCAEIYDGIDGAVSALYEYHLACRKQLPDDRLAYGGIPIDTQAIRPVELPDRIDRVRLFLGMHRDRKVEKGTDRIFEAARRVAERHPDRCTLEIVENLPYGEYIQRMRGSHVVLDQLYSYTPATNALLAMAMGLNTLSGGEEEYYEFIGEEHLRPIINAVPDDDALYATIENTVMHPELIKPRGREGRELVVKYNDTGVVARRFVDLWGRVLESKESGNGQNPK